MYIYSPNKSNSSEYISFFSYNLQDKLAKVPEIGLCEIRLSVNRPIILKYNQGRYFLSNTGSLTENPMEACICSRNELMKICERITEFSPYAYEDELKNSYITVRGGHRIGLAGEIKSGQVRNLGNISSIN